MRNGDVHNRIRLMGKYDSASRKMKSDGGGLNLGRKEKRFIVQSVSQSVRLVVISAGHNNRKWSIRHFLYCLVYR